MRKLFLSIIALTLSISAWAQETQSVNYIDENGVEQTVDAIVVTNATDPVTWGAVGTTSWYIVIVDDDNIVEIYGSGQTIEIMAKKAGTATITARLPNGSTATCEVIVDESANKLYVKNLLVSVNVYASAPVAFSYPFILLLFVTTNGT